MTILFTIHNRFELCFNVSLETTETILTKKNIFAMKRLKIIPISIFTLFVASCAAPTYNTLAEAQSYKAYGRSAIKAPEQSGQVGFSVEKNQNQALNITIQGPFAQGRVDMSIHDTYSTLTTNGETYSGATPDELFEKVTGFTWPVAGTRSWLQGVPSSAMTQVTYDNRQRPKSFTEDGWNVVYNEWMPASGISLPKRMTISRGDDLRIRLFIDNWIVR